MSAILSAEKLTKSFNRLCAVEGLLFHETFFSYSDLGFFVYYRR